MNQKSVVYINFSQYDNTGRILDYLSEQFDTVLHFSFDHLRLKNGRKTNLITLYHKGGKPQQKKLYSLLVPSFLLFPSLPAVAFFMVFQAIKHTLGFRKQIGLPIFFTVNAYSALIGILLRSMGLVSHVYYWVWDYFPVRGPSLPLKIIRYAYLGFDMLALRLSDTLIFPNHKQRKLRQKLHGIHGSYKIIPLGSSKPVRSYQKNSDTIGFLGMIKDSQGIDLILSCFDQILLKNPNIRFDIIGSGPDEERIRKAAKKYGNRVKFYGYIDDQNIINKIVRSWFVGLAIYEPVEGNESYFGDPSKIKVYLSQAVPIVTTHVTDYGRHAERYGFGITIPYQSKKLVESIEHIHKRQLTFRRKALAFAHRMYYRKVYQPMFQSLP